MTRAQIVDRVREIVISVAGPHRTPLEPGPSTALGQGGFWLDSIAMLELVIACEEDFGVTFDSATDMTEESLKTVESLAALIVSKRS